MRANFSEENQSALKKYFFRGEIKEAIEKIFS